MNCHVSSGAIGDDTKLPEASVRFARNGSYADETTPLSDSDEIAMIPPVSGGAASAQRILEIRFPVPAKLLRQPEDQIYADVVEASRTHRLHCRTCALRTVQSSHPPQ